MITSRKCRPRNSAGRFWLTESTYQIRPPDLQQIPRITIAGRKQTHGGETLFGFIEYGKRFSPCCLLLVIDLAEIRTVRCAVCPPDTRRFSTTLK